MAMTGRNVNSRVSGSHAPRSARRSAALSFSNTLAPQTPIDDYSIMSSALFRDQERGEELGLSVVDDTGLEPNESTRPA